MHQLNWTLTDRFRLSGHLKHTDFLALSYTISFLFYSVRFIYKSNSREPFFKNFFRLCPTGRNIIKMEVVVFVFSTVNAMDIYYVNTSCFYGPIRPLKNIATVLNIFLSIFPFYRIFILIFFSNNALVH